MERVYVCGLGAVSAAGWGVAPLSECLANGKPLPEEGLERPGWNRPLKIRTVPASAGRPALAGHPRLRRASPVTHYAAAAALEAVAKLPERFHPAGRLGVVVCVQSGPVQYASRFFQETLKDPATASPLLFPETVFAAPASHVAALLGSATTAYTLLGDPSAFLQGLALAVEWLGENRVDACLVVGAEEINWLHTDAFWQFDHQAVLTAGAGVVGLTLDRAASLGVELNAITDAFPFNTGAGRQRAAQAMREQLGSGSASELLCDSISGRACGHSAEALAWRDWPGSRLGVKRVLGEGLMAGSAWQCVAACEAVASRRFSAANVSIVGGCQQALGARFTTNST